MSFTCPRFSDRTLTCLDLSLSAEEENDNTKKDRLDKLAGFQLSMIRVRQNTSCSPQPVTLG